ncbi:phosphate/phosphite/phosphonate ABC transporter substrate-binding protein [Azonexus hydrophilus]|uniref:PhnD/SsuA/transferrin family substrate-binding protein n=1 Tax=Azonexus hydrophilus TaxID=418702 RepID=A0ABZ2XGY5_9RHOO|nr:PhnD/SsuA/transferrin family substrate-binding protein [Azonexus hydrophilus]
MTLPSRLAGLLRIAVLSCLGMINAVNAGELPPLKLGIMPFNSPLALIKTHQPLTAHLERSLGRKVVVFTSTDYFTHINQLLAGDFDLAITGPHFGAMAANRDMQLLFRYAIELQPVFVVRGDGPIISAEALRGKTIALSSRLSISSIGGIKWLQDKGFVLNRDFRIVEFSSHGAAVAAVIAGTADAAITTHTPLRQIPEDLRARTRLLDTDIHVPHVMTLAHRRLGSANLERVRRAFATFPETPEGKAFFIETGYKAYIPVSQSDLDSLQEFIEPTRQMMR